MKKLMSFLVAVIFWSSAPLMAQNYIVDNEESNLSILGTSTLHDWKINAEEIEGSAKLVKKGDDLTEITSLEINVPVVNMISGLDAMDDHMRIAMTANDSKAVQFKLTKILKISPNTINGFTIQAEGDLTIINNTKPKRLQVTMACKDKNTCRFFGETMIDMTEFNVSPPTAEMGSIKTEKDVKVVFDVVFKKK